MKHLGSENTPKSVLELKKERRRLQSKLEQLQGLARVTRRTNIRANLEKKGSIKEIEDQLREIDLALVERDRDPKAAMVKPMRTPPKKDSGDEKNATFTTVFTSDPPTTEAEDFFTSTSDIPNPIIGGAAAVPISSGSVPISVAQSTDKTAPGKTGDIHTTPISITQASGQFDPHFELPKPRFPTYEPMFRPRMPANPIGGFRDPFTDTFSSKFFNPTLPCNPKTAPTNVTYTIGANKFQEQEIDRLKNEMKHIRDLFSNKIQEQEAEIRALRSKQVHFAGVDTSRGAIPKQVHNRTGTPDQIFNVSRSQTPDQSAEFHQIQENLETGRASREPDPYVATLQTVTQLLRELQLDTRQKHELLNQILDNENPRNLQESRGRQTPTVFDIHDMQQPVRVAGAQRAHHVVEPRSAYLRRLRQIPTFDGESYKALRNFLDIAHALNESWVNTVEKNELIDTLNLQLRGEARDVVGDLYDITFEEMKDRLLKYFSYLVNKEVVTSQLENIRQKQNESMTEYSERARQLLKEKCSTYKFLSEEQKKEYDRTARRAFARGIIETNIKDRLVTRGAGSLEDAISYAIEAEFDSAISIPNAELYCRYCKTNGHRESSCRKKEANASGIGQLVNLLRGTPDQQQNTRNISNFRGRGNRSNRNWNNSRGNNNGNGQNDQRNNNNSKNWNNNWQNRGSNQNNNGQKNNNNNNNGNNNNQNQRNQNWRNQNNRNQSQNAAAEVQLNTVQPAVQNAEN